MPFAHITDMDRVTKALEDYCSAVSGLTIEELVAIGRAQIAAENAWQARLEGGFANRMVEATMSRQNADFVDLQTNFARRRAAVALTLISSGDAQSIAGDEPPEVVDRSRTFLTAEKVLRAIQQKTTGSSEGLPKLDGRSESVDIVIAYAIKALGSALIALRHREYLSEADFAFLMGPYASVIGGRK